MTPSKRCLTAAVLVAFVVASDPSLAKKSDRNRSIASGYDAAVSPDGTLLAHVRREGRNVDLWVSNLDGTQPRRLTTDEARDDSPSWSPSGEEIVFSSSRSGGRDLYVVRLETGELRRLTHSEADEDDPDWSPDGERIAFSLTDGKTRSIGVVGKGGGKALIFDPDRFGDESDPSWSPDGERLAFVTDRNGNLDIAVTEFGEDVRLDDNMEHALVAKSPYDESQPDWHPTEPWLAIAMDVPHSQRNLDMWNDDRKMRIKGTDEQKIRVLARVYTGIDPRPEQLVRAEHQANGPSWGPEGSVIYSATGYGDSAQNEPELRIQERALRVKKKKSKKKK